MSYFDDELEKSFSEAKISYKKLDKEKHDFFVKKINEKIPFSDSKIAWDLLQSSINFNENEGAFALKEISEKIKSLNIAEVIFIGDSTIEDAYQVNILDLEPALEILAEIPQHTYFFSDELSWIACITMEGHIDFGIPKA
jgi:hypothetical protein